MISIIIPTFNKASRLKFCLKHLISCETEYKIELILVNDGSEDETNYILQSIAKDCPDNILLKVFYTLNSGRASARNFGVERATNDIILFLDDDIVVDKSVIDMHVKSQRFFDNRIVHGKIKHIPYMKILRDIEKTNLSNNIYSKIALNFSNSIQEDLIHLKKYARDSSFERLVQQILIEQQELKWIGFVGANTSIKKKTFLLAGGFDCKFGLNWGCEDLEFGYRLNRFCDVEFTYDVSTHSYHLDHYEANRYHQHLDNMKYFMDKYNDKHIEELSVMLKALM